MTSCFFLLRFQLSLVVNCGLLEMTVSQVSVSTLLAATSLLSDVTEPLVSRFASVGSPLTPSEHAYCPYKEFKSSKESVISFCDDLRNGDFEYIMDCESG